MANLPGIVFVTLLWVVWPIYIFCAGLGMTCRRHDRPRWHFAAASALCLPATLTAVGMVILPPQPAWGASMMVPFMSVSTFGATLLYLQLRLAATGQHGVVDRIAGLVGAAIGIVLVLQLRAIASIG